MAWKDFAERNGIAGTAATQMSVRRNMKKKNKKQEVVSPFWNTFFLMIMVEIFLTIFSFAICAFFMLMFAGVQAMTTHVSIWTVTHEEFLFSNEVYIIISFGISLMLTAVFVAMD
jgi:hypothetical protein